MQNATWKRVQVENLTLASKGLIGIEECTDYNLINSIVKNGHTPQKRKSDNSTKKKGNKKKKLPGKQETLEILSPSKSGCSTKTVIVEDKDELPSYTPWDNYALPKVIIKALCEQGFAEPTPIQALTLPAAILGRRDIIGAAETGSGKTLAFGLPILAGILNEKMKVPQKRLYALILTPTRELAVQIKNHLLAISKYLDINVAVVVGGMASVKQERILNKSPEIVVATPGRLWELIQEGNPHLSQINDINFLVIDETDRMLEKGHFEELHHLLDRLNLDVTKQKKRQNFVFSATLTLVHDLPKYLLHKSKKIRKMHPEQKLQNIIKNLGITEPKIVDLTQGNGISKTLTECRINCAITEKDYYVYYFLQKHPGRTLIFCNSIGCVRRLAHLLNILQCNALPLHAAMQQRQRLKNLEKFRDDEFGILVATDVAARGLDIPKVEHVLHYQTPRTSESYVHRSGRTARASQQGITVLLIEPAEITKYVKMCKTLNKGEDLPLFPVKENYLNAVKERVNLARELDKLELAVRKGNSEVGWLEKAAQEMDIIIDDFVGKYDKSEFSSQKKAADAKRNLLNKLLAKPIFPQGFTGKYPLDIQDFNDNQEKAVDIAKKYAENARNIPLFKANKKNRK